LEQLRCSWGIITPFTFCVWREKRMAGPKNYISEACWGGELKTLWGRAQNVFSLVLYIINHQKYTVSVPPPPTTHTPQRRQKKVNWHMNQGKKDIWVKEVRVGRRTEEDLSSFPHCLSTKFWEARATDELAYSFLDSSELSSPLGTVVEQVLFYFQSYYEMQYKVNWIRGMTLENSVFTCITSMLWNCLVFKLSDMSAV
jgi:hypothetical protein